MRIIPIFVAALVAISLGALILKRDAVFSLVGRAPAGEGVVVERDETPEAEPAGSAIGAGVVPVVALTSAAQAVPTGIPLRGTTQAARFVELQSEISGLVISEPLRKGASVEAEQIVCELDPGTRIVEIEKLRTNLQDALDGADRANQLAAEGFGTETSRVTAEAAVRTARLAVEQAEKEISRLQIRAPFNGLLESDAAEIGSLLQRGSLCATIIQLHPIKLVGYVAETDVDRITTGSPAQATLVNGREVVGIVTFISRTGDPGTKTFRIEITVN
ncbi:MAG: efflux RND transporter periplasmic adaptor subunit, partial [Rhodobacteraceae bacterium]|nr:efflux RND transporter periplasmic adaptor subunit [Paracoccaceae bacterium]